MAAIAAEHFGSGTTAVKSDTRRYLLCKILMATVAGGGGGGGGGITSGAGAPVGAPASSPAIYIDTNTGAVYYFYSNAWH